jgi:hypothetical protein
MGLYFKYFFSWVPQDLDAAGLIVLSHTDDKGLTTEHLDHLAYVEANFH